jgi:hypothetical protein
MKQPTNDLAQLVKLAHDSLPELGQIVLLASNGQQVVGRPGDGVKSPSRILEKAQEVGLDGVVDIIGYTILVDSLSKAYDVLDRLSEMADVVRVKDRISKPTDVGYRDILVNVRLSSGLIGEVLIMTKPMFEAKLRGHFFYEMVRSNKATYVALKAQKRLYGRAWAKSLALGGTS